MRRPGPKKAKARPPQPGWKYALIIALIGLIAFWAGIAMGIGIGERSVPQPIFKQEMTE